MPFGDAGLLSLAENGVTVEVMEDSEVWCLDRVAFRMLIVSESVAQFGENVGFLKGCDLFSDLSSEQLAVLAECLQEEDFQADEAIIDQGDTDDNLFILRR